MHKTSDKWTEYPLKRLYLTNTVDWICMHTYIIKICISNNGLFRIEMIILCRNPD